MKLSVVIPYYRAADTIAAQLEALAAQTYPEPWEVIISDNESSEALREVVGRFQARLPGTRIVDSSDLAGEAHARNVGVEAAAGDFIVFCDADDQVAPGWLSAMGEALRRHDFVAARVDFEKLNPRWLDDLFRYHPQRQGLQQAWFPPYLYHAGGGTLGFRKSLQDTVGGFDETWPVLTDTDYCFRAQLAGVPLRFVPDAVIHCRCRSNYLGLFRQANSWAEHFVRLYKKYRPPGTEISHPWRRHFGEWEHLARTFPQVRSGENRPEWLWRLGWQLGLVQGSIKHRSHPV